MSLYDEFVTWSKIPRLHREWEITEKVDGTNGVLYWGTHDGRYDDATWLARVDDLFLKVGSRNRWLTPRTDNFGFAQWALDNLQELAVLGKGRHFGEWYGKGIQRGYGLDHKRFALFHPSKRNGEPLPKGVDVVPVLETTNGELLNDSVRVMLYHLRYKGSHIAPGFMRPEGVVVRHTQNGSRFKVLIENDEVPKSAKESCDA